MKAKMTVRQQLYPGAKRENDTSAVALTLRHVCDTGCEMTSSLCFSRGRQPTWLWIPLKTESCDLALNFKKGRCFSWDLALIIIRRIWGSTGGRIWSSRGDCLGTGPSVLPVIWDSRNAVKPPISLQLSPSGTGMLPKDTRDKKLSPWYLHCLSELRNQRNSHLFTKILDVKAFKCSYSISKKVKISVINDGTKGCWPCR